MEVNTTSQTSQTQSTEQSTIRELSNPNQNRVLNFVFRQMLQEYISITYLNNIKIAFTNGHPEHTVVVSIQELDQLLDSVIKPQFIDYVRSIIINEYLQVENYRNELLKFLEPIEFKKSIIREITEKEVKYEYTKSIYYKKCSQLEDIYELSSGNSLNIKVNGIILKVDTNTLRTPAIVVDSLLGQGDALDCFNQLQQQAAVEKVQSENLKLQQEVKLSESENKRKEVILELIKNLPPELQAETIKSVFGNCCNSGSITINNP